MYSQTTGELIKLFLAGGTAVLSIFYWALHRHSASFFRRGLIVLRTILVLLVLFGVANYYRFDAALLLKKINGYDMVHYYLGSKYFDELGYYHLYPALLLADSEDQRFFQRIGIQQYRDHRSQRIGSVDAILDYLPILRERFSPGRWTELKRDLRHFIEIMPVGEWKALFEDRGYNATPVSRWLGGCLSRAVSVDQLKLLGFIDIAFLLSAVAFIGIAYGVDAALFALMFLFTSFSSRWPPYGESMMRMDWICAMVVSMCLLRLRYSVLAGTFWGYAVAIRVFPVVFLYGLVVRVIAGLMRRSPNVRGDAKFLGAAVLSCLFLNEVVLLVDGPSPFRESARKLMVHQESQNISSQRVGFGIAIAYRGELSNEDSHSGKRWTRKKSLVETMKPYRYGAAVAVLYVVAVLSWRRRSDEVLAMGVAVFFFVSIASYYYYIMRVLLIVLHVRDLGRWTGKLGLALLFVIEVISQVHQQLDTSRYAATAQLSIALAVYFLAVLGIGVYEADRDSGGSEDGEPPTPS